MSDPLFDLTGRVAVVTGGIGQLGAELSVALAARGMRVAILDLDDRRLAEGRRASRPRSRKARSGRTRAT